MKAILVIDIPNHLSLSDLYISGGLWQAGQDDGWIYEFKAEDIKPMPKYDWHEEDKENECEEWYRNGWNDCLEEIEK